MTMYVTCCSGFSFPPACFSAFIAANSFKTTLPKVNPFVSVGIGTAVSALLAVTGLAGDVIGMFKLIGASFGPVCGAMAADYLLSGGKWAGPRAGFNLAGWISWAAGFLVGNGQENRTQTPAVTKSTTTVVFSLLVRLMRSSPWTPTVDVT